MWALHNTDNSKKTLPFCSLTSVDHLRREGRYAEAIKMLAERLKTHPLAGHEEARRAGRQLERHLLMRQYASLSLAYGAAEEALATYDDLIDELESDPCGSEIEWMQLWVLRAAAFIEVGSLDEALADLSWIEIQWRAREDDRLGLWLAELLYLRSRALLFHGEARAAERALKEASDTWMMHLDGDERFSAEERLDHKSMRFSFQLACIRAAQHRFEEALILFHQAGTTATKAYGASHPETARILAHLTEAAVSCDFPWPGLAELCEVTHTVLATHLRDDHPDLLTARYVCLRAHRKWQPAEVN